MQNDVNELWVTRAQGAKLIDITPRQFNDSVRPKLEAHEIRGNGPSRRYLASAIVRVRFDKSPDDPSLEPLAGDSPMLEKCREETWKRMRMENEERRGVLIPREEIQPAIMQLFGLVGDLGARQRQAFGNDAGDMINELLDEFSGRMREMFGKSNAESVGGGDTTGADAPLAIHAGVRRGGNRSPVRAVSGAAV